MVARLGADVYVAEYSASQGAYHVDPLNRSVQTNAHALAAGRALDYAPFHVGTEDECYAACRQMRIVRGEAGPNERAAC